jgi:hypothetical protein
VVGSKTAVGFGDPFARVLVEGVDADCWLTVVGFGDGREADVEMPVASPILSQNCGFERALEKRIKLPL